MASERTVALLMVVLWAPLQAEAQSRPSSEPETRAVAATTASRGTPWFAKVVDRISGQPVGGAQLRWSDATSHVVVRTTDPKGRLFDSLGDAGDVLVMLPASLGGMEVKSSRETWKLDGQGRLIIEIDAYARLVVYAKCGDDLCKFASIDAQAIPPLPDLSSLSEGQASFLQSARESDPITYVVMLKYHGLGGALPEIERKDAHGQSAELLVPYDGAVYVKVWAYWMGQSALLVQAKRGASQIINVSVPPSPVVSGVVLKDDGTPAKLTPIYVAARAVFPPGDFTPRGASMLIFRTHEDAENGRRQTTIHYRLTTDTDGRFVIPVLFTGEVCAYAFGEGGRVSLVTKTLKSHSTPVRDLEIRLPAPTPPARRMRFLDRVGGPITNARLGAERTEFIMETHGWSIQHVLNTDGDGMADVSGLKDGFEYFFKIEGSNGASEPLGQALVKDGSTVTAKDSSSSR